MAAGTSGRLADGYRVADLTWIDVTGPDGRIRYHHDGWLTPSALARAATRQASGS